MGSILNAPPTRSLALGIHIHIIPWTDEFYSCHEVLLDGTVDLKRERLSLSNHMSPLRLDLEVRDMESQRFEIAETLSCWS